MKIVIKVNAYTDLLGKDYNSLEDQFEVVTNGDSQRFLDLVGKIILLIPLEKVAEKPAEKPAEKVAEKIAEKTEDKPVEKKDETDAK